MVGYNIGLTMTMIMLFSILVDEGLFTIKWPRVAMKADHHQHKELQWMGFGLVMKYLTNE